MRAGGGFDTLRTIRDLHTLSAFIRLADHSDASATNELQRRIISIKAGDDQARWNEQ